MTKTVDELDGIKEMRAGRLISQINPLGKPMFAITSYGLMEIINIIWGEILVVTYTSYTDGTIRRALIYMSVSWKQKCAMGRLQGICLIN